MGPASNMSPILPSSSTSATNVSPIAPPITIAPNFCLPDKTFNSCAFFTPWLILGFFKSAYLPALLALSAFDANVVATLAPAPAGTPIDTNASVNLPAALSCATS